MSEFYVHLYKEHYQQFGISKRDRSYSADIGTYTGDIFNQQRDKIIAGIQLGGNKNGADKVLEERLRALFFPNKNGVKDDIFYQNFKAIMDAYIEQAFGGLQLDSQGWTKSG